MSSGSWVQEAGDGRRLVSARPVRGRAGRTPIRAGELGRGRRRRRDRRFRRSRWRARRRTAARARRSTDPLSPLAVPLFPLGRHPPPDGTGVPPARAPGQYRRLTHAHAAATGVTRQGAPAPNLLTASNGPSETGDDERHVSTTVHLPARPPLPDPGKDPSRPLAAPRRRREGTQLSHPTAAPRSGE